MTVFKSIMAFQQFYLVIYYQVLFCAREHVCTACMCGSVVCAYQCVCLHVYVCVTRPC